MYHTVPGKNIKIFIANILLKISTLIKVPSIQEYRIWSIFHDLIFLKVESGHSSKTLGLRSASRSVSIDLWIGYERESIVLYDDVEQFSTAHLRSVRGYR